MSYQTKKLLRLINEGKTCNEICEILHITNKQLYIKLTNLRNKGYHTERNFYDNGDIIYNLVSRMGSLKNLYTDFETKINMSDETKTFECLLVSDLHFGSELERLDLIDRAFNYCVNEGIHIIFNCGDLIDGTFGSEKNIIDTEKQIKHFIKDYPFEKNIITFGVCGDHDISCFNNNNLDITEIIRNYRHDIKIHNYNNSIVNIKSDKILLYHKIVCGKMFSVKNISLILNGHIHKYIVNYLKTDQTILNISIPSLSDINSSLPTALKMTLNFKDEHIDEIMLKQIFFGDKTYILNEHHYDINNKKKLKK